MENTKDPQIIPAILAGNIDEYVKQTKEYSEFSDIIHIDVMDGRYVETKSPDSTEILNYIKNTNTSINLHLMINNPIEEIRKLENYENLKLVYLHIELIDEAIFDKEFPFTIALVLNPDTEISKYKELYKKINVVQFMTVNPGKMGNPFVPSVLENIIKLRELGFTGEIHIDGHINNETIEEILKYKPDVLNVGSAISKSESPELAYRELVEKVRNIKY